MDESKTYSLRFAEPVGSSSEQLPPSSSVSYSLFELPSELLALIQDPASPTTALEFRGLKDDEAVLVTSSRTYALRSVQNSNSVMIVRVGEEGGGEEGEEKELKVLKTVGETIEAIDVTDIPGTRLARLEDLLDGTEYYGEEEERDRLRSGQGGASSPVTTSRSVVEPGQNGHPHSAKRRRVSGANGDGPMPHVTLSLLADQLRASDAEILLALRYSRAISLPSPSSPEPTFRRVPASLQIKFLSLVLTTLTASGISPTDGFSLDALLDAFEEDDDLLISRDAARQILAWYTPAPSSAEPDQLTKLDLPEVVGDLGKLILFGYETSRPLPLPRFLHEWESHLGGEASEFAPYISLTSLSSDALFDPSLSSTSPPLPTSSKEVDPNARITPFPGKELSPDAATRMRQLFAARPRWLVEDLTPFLRDLTGGQGKKADALVLKYCRKIKEKVQVQTSGEEKGKGKARGKVETQWKEVTWLSARNNW